MTFIQFVDFFQDSGTVFQLIISGLFLSTISVILKFLKATYQVNFGIVNKNTIKAFADLAEKIETLQKICQEQKEKTNNDISHIKKEINLIKNNILSKFSEKK